MCDPERTRCKKRLCAVFCLSYLCLICAPSRGASGVREPNAAELVRAVRQSENWIHEVDSFYLRMDSKWTTPPHPNLPEKMKRGRVGRPFETGTTDTVEYAFDGTRVRRMREQHGSSVYVRVWDGKEYIYYARSRARGQETYIRERYYLDSTPQEHFQDLGHEGSWLRSQPHSFWFDIKDVKKSLRWHGRYEDFVLTGREEYRGVSCYVLEFDQTGLSEYSEGRVRRWYVGAEDRLLYGNVHLRHGKIDTEHWTRDYQEVSKGCRLPMTQGYEIYRLDGEDKPYLYTRRDIKVVEVRVNEPLADELFEVHLKEGVEVTDNRSGERTKYIYKLPLVGKALPDSNGIDIDFAAERMRGKSLLLCFFDIEQRPSRHIVWELAKRTEKLKEKGVVVVCVQASKIAMGKLDEWVKESEIPFEVGMVDGDEEKVRFTWGVKLLPWLIMADKKHVVQGEGFGIDELGERIEALTD